MAARRIRLSWRSSSSNTRMGFLASPLPISIQPFTPVSRPALHSARKVLPCAIQVYPDEPKLMVGTTTLIAIVFVRIRSPTNRSGQPWQFGEQGHAAPPLFVVEGRRPAHHGARR